MAYEKKKYLFSHAGILFGWIKVNDFLFGSIESKDLVNYLNMLWWTKDTRRFLLRALADVSYARWGHKLYGSMVWADVKEHHTDSEEVPGYYQIFGHTTVKGPLITPTFACLDCKTAFYLNESGEIKSL